MVNSNWKLTSACLAASFLSGAVTSLFFRPLEVAAAQKSAVTREIRAQEFKLVGDDGVEYGGLSVRYGEHGNSGYFYLEERSHNEGGGPMVMHDGVVVEFEPKVGGYRLQVWRHNATPVWIQP